MTRMLFAAVACVLGLATTSAAQRDGFPPSRGDMSPEEVQQLFDAFELVRAEEMLDLTEEQYPEFVVRLKALQEGRRESQRQRQMMLRELRRLLNQNGADDDELEARLDALRTHERDAIEQRLADLAQIDSILDVRQRVRFRMFQQAMEQRRLELLMRARRPQLQRQRRDRF